MQTSPVALVTGANQGIGFQIAKELSAKGFIVLLGSRNLARGEAAASEVGPTAAALQLDVTDQASVTAAAERVRLEFGRLDVLIQNAAIATVSDREQTGEELAAANRPSVVSLDDMRTVWDTNVFGVLAVYQAMLPILRITPNARIVNVSSGAGSLTVVSDPRSPLRPLFDVSYAASKTALNALTVAMAIELEADGIKVNAVSPGYTKTRLTSFAGTETVAEGAAEAVRVALLGPDAPTGGFTHATIGPLPW
ncbi:SDR family NAD(P)-dependent oxidoreductase [Sphingomonas prati]|uniref:NAD(P)-dependent dehydrogenase (Short-subunit alcohol dehydrogenase family) n=1 Tax=Sphingomonas prati TaxID=1843237 RepID=A0A7W9BS08_9SPHN|nr:SDR family NAD(P)-dependent oxidoreductase [Sphingomonas prati]MBB5729027.1 NAD(P)-dependent dehydrogenase (short-subunit alcohol dehydrogenase family) [Sphingomonas prati]GGE85630.1 short-chain dehydrogenase [Sphingomonas prati]